MKRDEPLDTQVTTNLAKVEASPHFIGNRIWLTFYLTGRPEDLWRVSDALTAQGWVNTDDWDGGFLYPKVQSDRTASAIIEIARQTEQLCTDHGVEIINIDADTSPEVPRSHFITLFWSPR
jgi:hypothetical protein